MRKPTLLVVACMLTALSSCSKSERPAPANNTTNAAPSSVTPDEPAVDACALLTAAEIESIQGEPLKEVKPLTRSYGGLTASQCYFALPNLVNSISLQVLQKGTGADARDPRQTWSETFSKNTPLMKGAGKTGAPEKIEGLGEEALWVGNDAIGALNVLQGNHYITISVGGAGDRTTKKEKSAKLGRLVVDRLDKTH